MRKQNMMLTAWLLGPLAVLALIMWGVVISLRNPPKKMAPVGAGAGSTGSDNSAFRVFGTEQAVPAGARTATASEPPALAQPEGLAQGYVIVVEDKAKLATLESPIYIAGSFNNWNPGDAAFKLTPQSDMRWRIQMTPTADGKPIEFKFTRGTWELEELNPDMSKVKNRTLVPVDMSKLAPGEQPKIEFAVAHWGDELPQYAAARATDPYRALEVTGTVRRLQVSGGAGTAKGIERELLVWLPPGYDAPENASKKYPVLYMHDGQNLFAKHPGIPAEWGLDETAAGLLAKSEASPFILVGVPHSGAGRASEYTPAQLLSGVEPEGESHVRWLMNEVMPRIERTFRVATGPESTGVGGASLGGVISVYAVSKYPGVFGLLYAESVSFGAADREWAVVLDAMKTAPRRAYVGVGGKEVPTDEQKSARMVANAKELDAKLEGVGMGADRLMYLEEAAAEHNEQAWAGRAGTALRFLFPPPMDTTK